MSSHSTPNGVLPCGRPHELVSSEQTVYKLLVIFPLLSSWNCRRVAHHNRCRITISEVQFSLPPLVQGGKAGPVFPSLQIALTSRKNSGSMRAEANNHPRLQD